MKNILTVLIIGLFITASILINSVGQANLDARIAAGDQIRSPICAVNYYYNQSCSPGLRK